MVYPEVDHVTAASASKTLSQKARIVVGVHRPWTQLDTRSERKASPPASVRACVRTSTTDTNRNRSASCNGPPLDNASCQVETFLAYSTSGCVTLDASVLSIPPSRVGTLSSRRTTCCDNQSLPTMASKPSLDSRTTSDVISNSNLDLLCRRLPLVTQGVM